MKVPLRMERALRARHKEFDIIQQQQLFEETVVRVTEDLNNGTRRRMMRVVMDVPYEVGRAFEKAIAQNRAMRDVITHEILKIVLAREELRPR